MLGVNDIRGRTEQNSLREETPPIPNHSTSYGSMADTEIDVAVIALVVSLIALVIALAQLSQQLLGTAEGYRRCGSGVIGPWHRLRRRHFIWTEFRFEVKYMTPHLAVIAQEQNASGRLRHLSGPAYFANMLPRPQSSREAKLLRALHETICTDGDLEIANGFGDAADPTQLERRMVSQRSWHHDPEKQVQKSSSGHLSAVASHASSSKPSGEIFVTWLQLLREAHLIYEGRDAAATVDRNHSLSNEQPDRTNLAVAIREWAWDYMPADLLRPLATSTLNNVILIALRLNMQWRQLNLDNGVFLADGNGYSLTSVEIRGLGLGFQFSVIGAHETHRQCISSEAVDKMMFGIIPGHPTLVGQDYALVSDKRKIDGYPPTSVLEAIGIDDRDLRNDISRKKYWESHNEMVILLSKFLPLPGTSVSRNFFPAWLGPVGSVIHFWEGRMALMQGLRKRIDDTPKHKALATLESVLRELERLSKVYYDDFFCCWKTSILEAAESATQSKIDFLNDCRHVYSETTQYFLGERTRFAPGEGHHTYNWSSSSGERTQYVDLVAAHVCMAFRAIPLGHRERDEVSKNYRSREQRKAHFGITERANGGFALPQYTIARAYIANFSHPEHGTVKHLRSRNVDLHEDYMEAAWWVLMLRGIVWDMSTTGDPPFVKKGPWWEGEPVPSSFYYTKTPVWIT